MLTIPTSSGLSTTAFPILKIKTLLCELEGFVPKTGLLLVIQLSYEGATNKKSPGSLRSLRDFSCPLPEASSGRGHKKNPAHRAGLFLLVPKTGFEPARRFQRYHLKVVRLPISPPGPEGGQIYKI